MSQMLSHFSSIIQKQKMALVLKFYVMHIQTHANFLRKKFMLFFTDKPPSTDVDMAYRTSVHRGYRIGR